MFYFGEFCDSTDIEIDECARALSSLRISVFIFSVSSNEIVGGVWWVVAASGYQVTRTLITLLRGDFCGFIFNLQ